MFIRRMATLLSAGAFAIGISMAAAGAAHAVNPPSSDWNEIIASFDHNQENTLCVDDTGHTTAGTGIWLWHCNGTANVNQRWRFVPEGTAADGMTYYQIVLRPTLDRGPVECVGYPQGGVNITSGVRLTLEDCGGPSVVDWTMETAPGTNPLITLVDGLRNLCIAQADFSDNNGTPVIVKTCSNSDISQVWALG